MVKKTITYPGYDGNTYTDDFYFNLSRAELLRMEANSGGLKGLLEKIIEEKDSKNAYQLFEQVIQTSIGRKSANGKGFVKNDAIRDEFVQSEAYSELIISFLKNSDEASAFVNSLVSGAENENNAEATSTEVVSIT